MAKKIVGYIKLQVPAGKANPSPPGGGQQGAGHERGRLCSVLGSPVEDSVVRIEAHVDQ
jgi:hypothetical protein